jgi:hypothetical protein
LTLLDGARPLVMARRAEFPIVEHVPHVEGDPFAAAM